MYLEEVERQYENLLIIHQCIKIKGFDSARKSLSYAKTYFGSFVFEWDWRSIRFRKKLRQDTFFAKVENGCVALPTEGITFNISKNSHIELHMLDNGQMRVSASAPLQHVFELGAVATNFVSLDVTDNILPLPEQHLKRAGETF